MADWQPIDTAPETSAINEVLVSDGEGVFLAYWDKFENEWLDAANHNGYEHAVLAPSHWMPLPEPPNA